MNALDEGRESAEHLATRLRAMRRESGLTGSSLASALGWPQSKVSKLENARQLPTESDVRGWVGACGAAQGATQELLELLNNAQHQHRLFRDRFVKGVAAVQRDYDDLGLRASRIRNAEVAFVPGLLQTPSYARAVLAEAAGMNNRPESEVENAVSQRLIRQNNILYDDKKTFEFVLTEGVLRLLLCPPAAMAGQLDRLLTVLDLPNVYLGVIPFGVQLRRTPQNGFILFDDIAIVETFIGETVHTAAEAALYGQAMDDLVSESVTGTAAADIIKAALRDLPQRSS